MTPLEVLDAELQNASDRAASIGAAAVLDDTLRELLAALVLERPASHLDSEVRAQPIAFNLRSAGVRFGVYGLQRSIAKANKKPRNCGAFCLAK